MEARMNCVASLTWVKRGIAKRIPDRVAISREELKQIIENHQEDLITPELSENESDDENGERRRTQDEEMAEDNLNEYDLDNYDDEEDPITNPIAGLAGLTIYASNDDDPYITEKGDDDPEDAENFEIRPDDNLIVASRINGDACGLEVYVYNEKESHLYVHHDILLGSVPLCTEWLNFDPAESEAGNLVAVGLMNSEIQVWDIDLVDSLEPAFQLGKAIKKKKNVKSSNKGHTDAVLDLSWNHLIRNVLASASADNTVALWDMNEGTIVTSLKQFRDKVQTLQWHPFEAQMLLAGSYDKTVKLFDCRVDGTTNKSWTLNGEVERVIWNSHNPLLCYASTDKGSVYCLDPRVENPIWQIGAHSGACTALALSSQFPGLLVTASTDKSLKMWDIQSGQPSFVREKQMKMGQIHCVQPCPESGYVFCCGGDNKSHNFMVCDVDKFGTDGITYELAPEPDDMEALELPEVVIAPLPTEAEAEVEAEAEASTSSGLKKSKTKKKKKTHVKKPAPK